MAAIVIGLFVVAGALIYLGRDAGEAAAPSPVLVQGAMVVNSDGTVSITGDDGTARTYPVIASADTEVATLQTLAAAGRPILARITDGKVDSVVMAPPPGATASAPGRISAISDTSVALETTDGTEEFTIAPADLASMSVDHLRDHQTSGSGVIIHYDTVDGKSYARSFEDATAP